jgi:hypothetical protein
LKDLIIPAPGKNRAGRAAVTERKEDHSMIDDADIIIDLNAILHPGTVYEHPRDVVADQTISLGEKRSILASWASDAAAVASNPALRKLPGSHWLVTIDDVLEALYALDHDPKRPPGGKPARMKSFAGVSMAA